MVLDPDANAVMRGRVSLDFSARDLEGPHRLWSSFCFGMSPTSIHQNCRADSAACQERMHLSVQRLSVDDEQKPGASTWFCLTRHGSGRSAATEPRRIETDSGLCVHSLAPTSSEGTAVRYAVAHALHSVDRCNNAGVQ